VDECKPLVPGDVLKKVIPDLNRSPILAFNEARGMVEQLVCATTHEFVGTRGSSFSGQVNNLRGNSKWMYSVLDYGRIVFDVC